jgi:hypothetical protein
MSTLAFLRKSLSWFRRPLRPKPRIFQMSALIWRLGEKPVLGELEFSSRAWEPEEKQEISWPHVSV